MTLGLHNILKLYFQSRINMRNVHIAETARMAVTYIPCAIC